MLAVILIAAKPVEAGGKVLSYDRYECSDHAWLEIVRRGASYLATVDRLLKEVKCPTGGMPGITRGSTSPGRIRAGRRVCWAPSGRGWADRPSSSDVDSRVGGEPAPTVRVSATPQGPRVDGADVGGAHPDLPCCYQRAMKKQEPMKQAKELMVDDPSGYPDVFRRQSRGPGPADAEP